ncbi:bifunctional aminoglycoside phosphotransferase/ATP-binding protein [Bradyrhizobium sp. G127]|uniref:bifunctional aminoglycoside phosphotransferase/ATP-binding protein n=1 Tax=Bradyrhizobium sp. G127 TaxID=2904800 RepID=UPI001F34DD42|nr:bifunctional aminoglycoside phosphotransferase/ATP-binding protein [Bradyrhizobium sp. G127]MCF2524646.1 AAA family ATPase [Bradyrhizobium sp. G127]
MTISTAPAHPIQGQILAALMDPAIHGDCPVRRIDTHAASVFLSGSRALKIKRAVRFPFLDYSTLTRRKAACDEELKINRIFAPQIYRRVVPITQHGDDRFAIDGDGPAVEWAIEMARFDENLTLDHLAEARPLSSDFAESVADVIAASHAVAPIAVTGPWIDSIAVIIARNTEAFRSAGCFDVKDIQSLDDASRSAFARTRILLERRGQQGFVRRCHGDLHLANIVSIEGKPVLFDAVEFDPAIASIDVLYDLAFPLMDLHRYGQSEAAGVLLNRYLAKTPEDNFDALALLPLFLSMRAAIRAHVLLARLDQTGKDRDKILSAARIYFELARQSISPPAAKLIAVGGLSGTGKSALARALAGLTEPLPGAVILRSDIIRKQLFQVSETDRLPDTAYQSEVTQRVYRTLAERAVRALSQGHSVIVDAVYAREAERGAIARVATDMSLSFVGLFLTADLATRMKRIGGRVNDASDATSELARIQDSYDVGSINWTSVDASGSPEQTLAQSKAALLDSARLGSGSK